MSDFNKSENDNIIMNEKEETLLLDHCYDGIEEFDYPLPTWWKWTFWGGIIFGAFYIYFYLVAGGPTLKDEYEKELARVEKVQEEQRLLTGNFDLQEFKQWSNKPESTNMAALVYEENCLSCHEEGGKGDIGPNLTDKHWVNLKEVNPQSIYSFIRVGNEDKGMPAWQDVLSKEELFAAVKYVQSLNNTFVAGGKEAQGELINE